MYSLAVVVYVNPSVFWEKGNQCLPPDSAGTVREPSVSVPAKTEREESSSVNYNITYTT